MENKLSKKNKFSETVSKITAEAGGLDGEIDLRWKPVRGAERYIIQSSAGKKWREIDIVTKSVYTVTGLKSGREYSFRVAAVGLGGSSGWSESVMKKST